jgi:hypothetical protein
MPQELWTWTLWYKDSDTCEEHGYTWGEGCAERGDAVCQYLFGWRLHLDTTRNKMQSERARYDRIRLWYFSTRVLNIHFRISVCCSGVAQHARAWF